MKNKLKQSEKRELATALFDPKNDNLEPNEKLKKATQRYKKSIAFKTQ